MAVSRDLPRVTLAAAAELPTRAGRFRVMVFTNELDATETVAMVHGELRASDETLVRLHSECLTGDVMGSLRCDCREQLERGLVAVAAAPSGVVVYLRQEGRGIGLVNKIRAYALQEQGLDTIDANLALGFREDERDYSIAVAVLRTLGVARLRLLTNNPDKLRQLESHGMTVKREAHAFPPSVHNARYLETKASRAGHMLGRAQ